MREKIYTFAKELMIYSFRLVFVFEYLVLNLFEDFHFGFRRWLAKVGSLFYLILYLNTIYNY